MTTCSIMVKARGLFKPVLFQFLPLTCHGTRSLSSTQSRLAVDKALLSKLRKQTGIPFINCKKALEKFDNDLVQAKKWLEEEAQREGWAKATKLQSRPMSQGLIAILRDNRHATMIEVNCETDFVARNEKFVSMVKELLKECDAHFKSQSENKVTTFKDHLNKIVSSQQTTLGDMLALNVGNLGENMALRRAAFLRCDPDASVSAYVHPSAGRNPQSLLLGKYGAMVELRQDQSIQPGIPLAELSGHLCQHIVGMNPKSLGEYVPTGEVSSEGEAKEGEDSGAELSGDAEDRLLCQEFLLDTSMTVGELAHSNGVEVKGFFRFACGEEAEDDKES